MITISTLITLYIGFYINTTYINVAIIVSKIEKYRRYYVKKIGSNPFIIYCRLHCSKRLYFISYCTIYIFFYTWSVSSQNLSLERFISRRHVHNENSNIRGEFLQQFVTSNRCKNVMILLRNLLFYQPWVYSEINQLVHVFIAHTTVLLYLPTKEYRICKIGTINYRNDYYSCTANNCTHLLFSNL